MAQPGPWGQFLVQHKAFHCDGMSVGHGSCPHKATGEDSRYGFARWCLEFSLWGQDSAFLLLGLLLPKPVFENCMAKKPVLSLFSLSEKFIPTCVRGFAADRL